MSYNTIRHNVSDPGITLIALDQPETRNALSNELLDELIDALEHAREDPDTRCVNGCVAHPRVFPRKRGQLT